MAFAKRLVFVLPIAAIIVISGCKTDTTTSPQTRVYHIGMVQWAAFSPLNVADVKGFWTSQGMKIVVDNFAINTDLNNALDSGRIDIALDMIGSWVDLYLQGKPLKVIGETDWSNGGDKIIIKKGTTLESLKGQKFGTYLKLLSVDNFISKYLTAHGLKFSDFVIEQESDPHLLADKFISGTYGVTANYDPEATRATNTGNGMVAATSADFPGCIPEGFVARKDVLAGIPQGDLIKIFKGWITAVKWTADTTHWAEYRTILNSKTYAGASFTDAELHDFLSSVNVHTQTEQLAANQTNGGLYTFLTQLNLFAQSNGFAGKTFAPQDVFDNTALVMALNQ